MMSHEDYTKLFLTTAAILLVFAFIVSLGGCSKAPTRYVPGQQYGDGGATACMNGKCPKVNQPRKWLKDCAPR